MFHTKHKHKMLYESAIERRELSFVSRFRSKPFKIKVVIQIKFVILAVY